MTEDAKEPCTCGSGQHPRVCMKHPLGYAAHITRLDLESYMEDSMPADVVWNKWWLAHVADMQQRIDAAVQARVEQITDEIAALCGAPFPHVVRLQNVVMRCSELQYPTLEPPIPGDE